MVCQHVGKNDDSICHVGHCELTITVGMIRYKQVQIQPTPTIEEAVLRLVYKSIRGVGVLGPDAAPVESIDLESFIAPEVCSLRTPKQAK